MPKPPVDKVLDDGLVREMLDLVAGSWRSLEVKSATMATVGFDNQAAIDECLELLCKHYGLMATSRATWPKYFHDLRDNFRRALKILSIVLDLNGAIDSFKRAIEVDWKAHIELLKEKRYQDHIIHPIRVTAVGWWLLHRDGGKLLKAYAGKYKSATNTYLKSNGIDISGWWEINPENDTMLDLLEQTYEYRREHANTLSKWEAVVEYAWLACGLLHDIGYPIEYHLRAEERLRESYPNHLETMDGTERRLSSAKSRRALLRQLDGAWLTDAKLGLDRRLHKLCNNADKEKTYKHAHAPLGGLHLLHLLLPRKLHSVKGLVVQLAARAIITHHDKDIRPVVRDPLSRLLYLADNLQMWDRQFFYIEALKDEAGSQKIRRVVECEKVEIVLSGSEVLVKYWMNKKEMEILKSERGWKSSKFIEPYRKVEEVCKKDGCLPHLILSSMECIEPESFRDL